MAWYLNRALTTYRNEVNAEYPNRDKASDGTIGDAAHQETSSDHNPDSDGSVDAWDMDVDLKVPNTATELERLKTVFQAHPAARYWIHNRQIAHRSTGWKRESYSGPSPHTEHVHWNSEPAYEDSTRPWGVAKETDLDATQDARLKSVETKVSSVEWRVNYLYELGTRAQGGMLTMTDGKTPIVWSDWQVREEKWQKAKDAELAAIKADLGTVKAALATPPGAVEISDEQLERVLRKVIGSVDGVA